MKSRKSMLIVGLTAFGLGSFVLGRGPGDSPAQVPDNVNTIIKQSCGVTGCHSGKYPAGNLNFEPDKFAASVVNAPSREAPNLKIVDTATPEKSYLLAKIKGNPGIVGKRMPANRDPLPEEQIQQIEAWIKSLGTSSSSSSRTRSGSSIPSTPRGAV